MNTYQVVLTDTAREHIQKHIRSGNKHLTAKIESFIAELARHPRTGTGQPERLRYMGEDVWSRRIDSKHRLVYRIFEDKFVVITTSAYGHYGDK